MAADWPQWGGTDSRNLVSPEKNLPTGFDPQKGRAGDDANVRWVRKIGNAAYGNPKHYRFRKGKEIPYYEGDKRKRWSTNKHDGKFVGPSQIIGTPVLYKNSVYVAIGQDPMHGRGKGMLHCVDPTGKGDITKNGCVWTYDGLDRSMATVSIAGGLLYVSDVAGRLHCLDADTGKIRWVCETHTETWGGALLADGKAYMCTKKYLYVFAQGAEVKLLSKIRLGSAIYSTPIAANRTLYVASQRELWAASIKP